MKTYFHVASKKYQGGNLYSWNILLNNDLVSEDDWKWQEAEIGFDGDVICLFDNRAEAEEFSLDYGGKILTISIPDDLRDVYVNTQYGSFFPRMTQVGEGYNAVYDCIPQEWINA